MENQIASTFVKAPQFLIRTEVRNTLITIGVIGKNEQKKRGIPDYITPYCLKISHTHEFYYLLTLEGMVLNISTEWHKVDVAPWFVVKFVTEELIDPAQEKYLEIGFFDDMQEMCHVTQLVESNRR